MKEWSKILDGFLTVAGRPLLEGFGNISAFEAKLKSEREHEVFRKRQDIEYVSNFVFLAITKLWIFFLFYFS